MKDEIKIGLCGLGTVGSGVFRLLQENQALIRDRLNASVRVTRIATIDPYDNLGLDLSDVIITDSVDDVLTDPDIDVVVELIGGLTIAKSVVLRALDSGKSAVTANKALLAECSEEIFTKAYQSTGGFGYEASVAGGIPIIRSIRQGFSGDRIDEISGIVNGTANYILSSMSSKGVDFDFALKEAQVKGYAEADPTLDIGGGDAAHKLLLLMQLAYHRIFNFDDLYVEGITDIESVDISIASNLGFVIKLMAMTEESEEGIVGKVHPALVSKESILAGVNGAFNAVSVVGNYVGHTMSYGAGAGSKPTASAVVADIIEIARTIKEDRKDTIPPLVVPMDKMGKGEILPIHQTSSEFYLRIGVTDEKTKLGEIVNCLSENNIELRLLNQNEIEGEAEPRRCVIILTGLASETDIEKAMSQIRELSFVTKECKLIRVYSGN